MGWKESDVIADWRSERLEKIRKMRMLELERAGRLTGWTPETSLVRWMSMTSGRSFLRMEVEVIEVCVRGAVDWSNLARG